ncbi:hypothetical protein ASF88_07005 [Leifsonia sp. Leaf336]|uniref:hypothetical protein n=1 Tax=Leifsonia sp. Leaf336 TaxID=1736341 RepID=UPI0006F3ED30|nr:hypothetical protein [Leifsonia sp. Leaf336]KQR54520.1 hypothetical protein ASF88_07005 [Leifsonia sp. Leaf336]
MPRTIVEKLLIKSGDALSLVGAGAEERAVLGDMPSGIVEVAPAEAAVSVTFVRTRDELVTQFGTELPVLAGARAVWFLYPKGGRADVNRDTIIREAGPFGWRAISNVAVDDVWSAVRVRPLADGEASIG